MKMLKNRTPDPAEAAPQDASPRLFENRTVDPEDSADPEEPEVIAGVASGVPVGVDASRFAIEHHGLLIRSRTGRDVVLDGDAVQQVLAKTMPQAPVGPAGTVPELGTLQPGALVTEEAFAEMTGKECVESIRRAIERGELPRSAKLMGKRIWTVGVLVRHITARLEHAALEAEKAARRISKLPT